MDKLNTNMYATLMVGAQLTYSGGREFESHPSPFSFLLSTAATRVADQAQTAQAQRVATQQIHQPKI